MWSRRYPQIAVTSLGAREADAAGLIGSKRVAAGLIGVVLVKSILIAALVATGPGPLAGPAPASQRSDEDSTDQPLETDNSTEGAETVDEGSRTTTPALSGLDAGEVLADEACLACATR